ncbi:uncharacterized protein LOC121715456 isoform X2 [Alosa sapidissima]|uniref:uncharacterized protein LOC121715456 isoform X2 n=1 Tax=Alosa sapidissima TaxID=34773 RepID=UPI001C08799C|nr:uncharacterized protein LOC121715456 isoform X2 [Alosa sapidissima]XP_041957160.1 uncharacterized protein LOC121715456 isoform X2 [Alosa sapidissima]
MLIKVQYRGLKKYLKLQPGFSYESFIEEEFGPAGSSTLMLHFSEVIWRGPLQTRDINLLVQERTPLPPRPCSKKGQMGALLKKSSGGEETMEEYKRLSPLTHCTRRHHILVSHIVEMHGYVLFCNVKKQSRSIVVHI